MKNYIQKARNINIWIYPGHFNNHIENYKINRDNGNIQIKYMDGTEKEQSNSEITPEYLEQVQRKQLEEQQKRVETHANRQMRTNAQIAGVWLFNAALQFALSNAIAGCCQLFCSTFFLANIYRPYKLKKEIELVSWISDNKEKVNELIKTEIKNQFQTQNIDYEALPYPIEVINDGINLNNIDLIEIKQLKKLKKKVETRVNL